MKRFTIVVLYLVLVAAIIVAAYVLFPLKTTDDYKNFGVVVGIGFTAVTSLIGMLVSFTTLSEQKNAARELEKLKANFATELENFKANLARELEVVKQATSVKSQAYNQICVAANKCYRELEHLSEGKYDKTKVEAAEQLLMDAEGLMFNLDKDTQRIVHDVQQNILNIIDSANETVKNSSPAQLEKALQRIWIDRAPEFGQSINVLRDRAPFLQVQVSKA